MKQENQDLRLISDLIFIRSCYALLIFDPMIAIAGYYLSKPGWIFIHILINFTLTLVLIGVSRYLTYFRFPKLLLIANLYYLLVLLWYSGVNHSNNGTAALLLLGLISISIFPRALIILNILNFGCAALLIGISVGSFKVDYMISYGLVLIAGNALLSIMLRSHYHDKRNVSEAYEEAKKLSLIDPLTGLSNRRHIENCVLDLINNKEEESSENISLILLDIDHFKQVNDTYGHGIGDQVLVRVAHLIKEVVRNDLIGRFGGEEFIVILTCKSLDDALTAAERIRHHIESCDMRFINPELRGISTSIGVTNINPNESFQTAFKRADSALYRAKAEGRNQVAFS